MAARLAPKLSGSSAEHLEQLVSLRWPGNPFHRSPFNVTSTYVQISPDDERLTAGEITISPDARGPHVEISGDLFYGGGKAAARRRYSLLIVLFGASKRG